MPAEVDDRDLMLRFRDGDVTAFETLYARHGGGLYRYCLRHTGDPESAADLSQEVWGKLISGRGRYRPTARFNTYLYRIARNCCIDHYRRGARQPPVSSGDFDETLDKIPSGDVPEPDIDVDRAFLIAEFRRALNELPAEQRDAFLLREEAGLSLEEIALVTGVGMETAKSRLRYAVRKLRAAILSEAAEIAGIEP